MVSSSSTSPPSPAAADDRSANSYSSKRPTSPTRSKQGSSPISRSSTFLADGEGTRGSTVLPAPQDATVVGVVAGPGAAAGAAPVAAVEAIVAVGAEATSRGSGVGKVSDDRVGHHENTGSCSSYGGFDEKVAGSGDAVNETELSGINSREEHRGGDDDINKGAVAQRITRNSLQNSSQTDDHCRGCSRDRGGRGGESGGEVDGTTTANVVTTVAHSSLVENSVQSDSNNNTGNTRLDDTRHQQSAPGPTRSRPLRTKKKKNVLKGTRISPRSPTRRGRRGVSSRAGGRDWEKEAKRRRKLYKKIAKEARTTARAMPVGGDGGGSDEWDADGGGNRDGPEGWAVCDGTESAVDLGPYQGVQSVALEHR